MLDICKKLFGDWNTKEIRYCHWKSNEHLMEGLDGDTDLDVFVHPDDKSVAEASLAEVGYIKLIIQKGSRYPLVDEWLGFDFDTGRLIHVHLHYQIITGAKHCKEYVFPIDEEIIASRILDEETDVYVAAPELEIIILYSRVALKATDKKNISPKGDYQKEIDFLKERADNAVIRGNCVALMGSDGEEFASLIEKEDLSAAEWQSVFRLSRNWLKKHKKMSAARVKFRLKYFRYRAMANAVLKKKFGKLPITKKTFPSGGKSICFIGADGSGKSTVGTDIRKWLNWKVEASRFYLGSGDHYNSLLKKILAKGRDVRSHEDKPVKVEITGAGESKEAPKKKKRSLKMRIMKYGFDILQCVYLRKIAARALKKLKQAKKYMKKGGIALYDRFPQDQFPGLYDGPKIAVRDMKCRLFAKLQASREERAIRKAQKYQPDLLFKLVLAPEESIRRKPDHSLEDVSQKAEITEKLVFERSKVVEIDASQPYDQEILAIKREIWSVLTK